MIQFRSKYSNKVNEETVSNYEKKNNLIIKKSYFLLANSLGSSSPRRVDEPCGGYDEKKRNENGKNLI